MLQIVSNFIEDIFSPMLDIYTWPNKITWRNFFISDWKKCTIIIKVCMNVHKMSNSHQNPHIVYPALSKGDPLLIPHNVSHCSETTSFPCLAKIYINHSCCTFIIVELDYLSDDSIIPSFRPPLGLNISTTEFIIYFQSYFLITSLNHSVMECVVVVL